MTSYEDDDDRDSGASSVILAFLLGGLTGAALALLYAPRSGKETRDLLGERVRETAERGRELKEEAVGRGRALVTTRPTTSSGRSRTSSSARSGSRPRSRRAARRTARRSRRRTSRSSRPPAPPLQAGSRGPRPSRGEWTRWGWSF